MVEFVEVPGIPATPQRGIYFLRMDDDSVNAETIFNEMQQQKKKPAQGKKIRRAMDFWVKGHDSKPKLHHGWDRSKHNGEFVDMHVFKANGHRIYGYKFHPSANPRFVACILIQHLKKATSDAPVNKMRKILAIAKREEVQGFCRRFEY